MPKVMKIFKASKTRRYRVDFQSNYGRWLDIYERRTYLGALLEAWFGRCATGSSYRVVDLWSEED